MNNSLKDTIEVVNFAEKELESIINEISLQNEKLTNMQTKIGKTHLHLTKNLKLIENMFEVTKIKLIVAIIVSLFIFVISIYLI